MLTVLSVSLSLPIASAAAGVKRSSRSYVAVSSQRSRNCVRGTRSPASVSAAPKPSYVARKAWRAPPCRAGTTSTHAGAHPSAAWSPQRLQR